MLLSPPVSTPNDNDLLAAAFEAIDIGVCFLDETGLLVRANRAFCQMFGYAPAEIPGQHWSLLAVPQEAAAIDRLLAGLFANASDIAAEWQLRCKDGSYLSTLVSSRMLTAASGTRHAMLMLTQDDNASPIGNHLTGPSRSDDSLKRSLEQRETILEHTMVAIVLLDSKGRVQWANRAMYRLFGLEGEDYVGSSLERYHPSREEYLKVGVAASNAILQGQAYEEELLMQRSDGSLFWAYLSGKAINPNDSFGGTVWVVMDISKRRELEDNLNHSEEQHRRVLDNVTDGIIVVQDGYIVYANPSAFSLIGRSQVDLFSQPFTACIHPDDRAKVRERHAGRLRGEAVEKSYAFRIINEISGNIIWLDLSGVVIEWEGRPATLTFFTDSTERRRLEDSLKQSLDERNTILENSIVGMVFLNPQGRVNWANSALYQIFGVTDAGPLGKSLELYYPSREDYLRTGAAVLAAVHEGIAYEAELRMRRADGNLFWAYLSGRAVNPSDLSRGTVWVVMDITKRRQLEEDLNKSEEQNRHVVDNVTECILVVQNGHIVFANQRVFQLTGYGQQELFHNPFVTAIHPDDRAFVIDRHLSRLRGEKVEQHYQFRLINGQSGAIVWVELSAVLIEWGGRSATLSFMTDVTERRHLEESLKQSMAESVRLQKLQFEHELREADTARRDAEEATRAKSLFLANMSHEIRTPMNAIIGMAHLALRTELNVRQRDYLEKIHGAGISLLGIINDILDFSKIEAGKLDMEQVHFNLDDVLANVCAVTSARAHEKDLEYLVQVPPDIPRHLVGDPLRLGQVLINLIHNAIKFTERGEISITCHQLETGEDQVQLEFEVRDTGIGMSQEQAAKLFRAFSQADESTTRKYGGTGLGLSISKGVIELMGGTIWLHSETRIGSVIHFTARFGLVDMHETPVVPKTLNGMRILVVDDNPTACAILAENLLTLPVEVDIARDGFEALTAIRACDESRPYGIVFTDLRMPGLDGLELISQVKRDLVLQSPPRMVLVSAYGRDEMRYRAESALADRFLAKPVNASTLVDTLVGLLAAGSPVSPSRHRGSLPRFHDLRILLVEDNDVNQQIATELMESAGIAVQVAGNGRIAVERLLADGAAHYGLVFMDVQMPEMDGHEATRRIRADARFSELPIIAMTAHAMLEEHQRCLSSGMNGHLAKPVNPAELYRTISHWCPGHLHENAAETGDTDMQETAPPGSGNPNPLRIAGIDVEDGLARMLGNRAFYLQMLQRFHDGQRDTVAHIRHALDAGDRPLAERLVHTLKGIAGQLGAKPIHAQADRLETEIRHGTGSVPALLAQLERDLQDLHAALARILPEAVPGTPPPGPVDRIAAQTIITRIAALLRECDGEAIDLLGETHELLSAALGSDPHKQITRAVRQFDFDGALAALGQGAHAAGYQL